MTQNFQVNFHLFSRKIKAHSHDGLKEDHRQQARLSQYPATNSSSSLSSNVPTHPIGTRRKRNSLLDLFDQISSMLSDNPLYYSSSTHSSEEASPRGSSVARCLSFKGKDVQSSDHAIPTSPSKPHSEVINVITTNTTSLEEQVASLTKTMESIIESLKQRDK